MIQEYLFIDDTHREAVEKYVPDKATREIHDIDNSTCTIHKNPLSVISILSFSYNN